MCGRFTLASKVSDLLELIDFADDALPNGVAARYNIAPTQPVLAIRAEKDFARPLPVMLGWGLVPFWADDPKIGSRMINARSESVVEKPAFRAALKYRRCIIPADGFFEWHKSVESNAKTPYWIHRHNRKPFALAGLWESWNKDGSGPLETCTILTTSANAMMSMLHDRMPVILEPKDFDRWLHTPPEASRELTSLFHPAPDDYLEAWPVSKAVNSPGNQGENLIEPT